MYLSLNFNQFQANKQNQHHHHQHYHQIISFLFVKLWKNTRKALKWKINNEKKKEINAKIAAAAEWKRKRFG